MTKDKVEKQGSETPSYLLEPITLEEGLVIPPPTRPMGPRRLARYYEEVADYLRAQQRGDEELPEPPLFMGVLEGQEQEASSSLAALSQLGSIEQGQDEEVELALSADTRTLLEDPLGHVTAQVLGQSQEPAEPAGPPADLATATDLESTATGFIDLAELAAAQEPDPEEELPTGAELPEPDEPLEEGESLEETSEPEPRVEEADQQEEETTSQEADQQDTALQEQVAAIIARAQVDDGAVESAPAQEPEGEQVPGQMLAELPQPVAATSAQGLDFADLDAAIAPRSPELAQETPAQEAQGQESSLLAEEEQEAAPQAPELEGDQAPTSGQDVLGAEPELAEEEEEASSNRSLLLALLLGLLLLSLALLYFMFFA